MATNNQKFASRTGGLRNVRNDAFKISLVRNKYPLSVTTAQARDAAEFQRWRRRRNSP
jgi:hypothetical protein